MSETEDTPLLLDFSIPLFRDSNPLQIFIPASGLQRVTIRQFTDLAEWRRHVLDLRAFRSTAPAVFRHKHDQALRLLFLTWLDDSVIKFAELGALVVLEGVINARYPDQKFHGLACGLAHMINRGLTDEAFQSYRENGLGVVQNLRPSSKVGNNPSFSEIRNQLAHGDPFNTLPWCGLFEIVRDLIYFMYPRRETPVDR